MRDIAKKIIDMAAQGDIAAFEKIYKEYASCVYTLALGVVQNREDAEEAVQDVFIKAYRSLENFRFGSSFGTWIYRVTMNTAINIYNKRAKMRAVAPADYVEGLDAQKGPDATREGLAQKDAAERVGRILKNLSPDHRACIVLREIEGLDYKEMARVLAIPINTVRSRLKRARQALVAYCRKEELNYGM